MNVKPKFVYYDIRRKQSVCLIMYTHENDVDTQVLEVSMLDNGEPIELDADYTYSAAIVNRNTKALINDSISCELNDSGNVLIPIDNFHTLGAQDLLIELTISDSDGNQVLVTPFPLWIHVNASILDDAQVTPESQGTVPELLEEAKEALENAGDYENLENKPQINGHELVGNKSSDDLGLQNKLTAGENITINANGEISASGGVTSYKQLSDLPTLYYTTAESYHLSRQPFRTFLNFSTGLYCNSGDGGVSVNVRRDEFFWCDDSEYGWNIDSPGQLQGRSFSSVVIPSRLRSCPEIVTNSIISNEKVIFWQIGNGKIEKTAQFIAWKDTDGNSRLIYRQADNLDSTLSGAWIEVNPSIVSASVNQNGTITFTMSDGSTVTTTGESVIGPQGPAGADGDDYVLTTQDKTDIANIVLSELPTTRGVQYGNTSN